MLCSLFRGLYIDGNTKIVYLHNVEIIEYLIENIVLVDHHYVLRLTFIAVGVFRIFNKTVILFFITQLGVIVRGGF